MERIRLERKVIGRAPPDQYVDKQPERNPGEGQRRLWRGLNEWGRASQLCSAGHGAGTLRLLQAVTNMIARVSLWLAASVGIGRVNNTPFKPRSDQAHTILPETRWWQGGVNAAGLHGDPVDPNVLDEHQPGPVTLPKEVGSHWAQSAAGSAPATSWSCSPFWRCLTLWL